MLITKLRTEHGLLDLTPVALFHTRRMSKVRAKLEQHHAMLLARQAKERKRQQEIEEDRKREAYLAKLKKDHPKEWQGYQNQLTLAQSAAQYSRRGLTHHISH